MSGQDALFGAVCTHRRLAARLMGRPAVGVEVEERYCETAARRLSQGVLL